MTDTDSANAVRAPKSIGGDRESRVRIETLLEPLVRFLGAPGDWGYGTDIGDFTMSAHQLLRRLSAVKREEREQDDAIEPREKALLALKEAKRHLQHLDEFEGDLTAYDSLQATRDAIRHLETGT